MKKEVFQEDSFSFYALSLSRVTKIPRWALLNWHHRSIILVVGGGKLIDICMSKKQEHAHLEILNFFSHVTGTGFTRQDSNLLHSIGINRKVAVGSKRGKQDIARNTLTHKRVEHTGGVEIFDFGIFGGQ